MCVWYCARHGRAESTQPELYRCQSWCAESRLSSAPCQASCCSLFFLLFPSKIGTYSHTCSELRGRTVRAAEVCWRTEVLWLCLLLLVQFLLPVLVFLNNKTVQKQLVDPFCSSRTSKSKGLAQQLKSEHKLLLY